MQEHIGRLFMEKTGFGHFEKSDQMKGLPQPPLELPCPANATLIDLPPHDDIEVNAVSLREAVERRESIRNFMYSPMSLDELSFALWCAQGVQKVQDATATFRNVPSAGARHAFETYLLINNVEGLVPGLYRYLAIEHKLFLIDPDPVTAKQIAQGCMDQPFIASSAVTFILTAVAERMTWRYGERGYRYLHLDAGHVGQNLYLAAEAIECGACAVGAFLDDTVNSALGIDGEKQFTIYIVAMGKKKRDSAPDGMIEL